MVKFKEMLNRSFEHPVKSVKKKDFLTLNQSFDKLPSKSKHFSI